MVILGMVLVAGAMSIPYLQSLDTAESKAEVKIGDQFIIADVAKDAPARERGLGGRKSIGINEGMLFVFEEPARHPFWMKYMRFPIDIIWISEQDVIVGITENVLPEPGAAESELRNYYPPVPVLRVLEVAAGRTKLFKAGIGSAISIRPLAQRLGAQ